MRSLIIGNGEIGSALAKLLDKAYPGKVWVYDINAPKTEENLKCGPNITHLCIPYSPDFVSIVCDYVEKTTLPGPVTIVIHSSVVPGVTEAIAQKTGRHVFYSPVRGKHPDMEAGLKAYKKYIYFDGSFGQDLASDLSNYFFKAGIICKTSPGTKKGELAKLLALCRYGVNIAFAKEQESICEAFGVKYWDTVAEWEKSRSDGLTALGGENIKLIQPQLYPFQDYIGGHCCVEDMELLINYIQENPSKFKNLGMEILKAAYKIGRNTKIWEPCKVYDTAIIGKGCNIGVNCEIGHKVKIGNGVRIGHGCFLPEGVTIEDDCFIAPGVFFSNDKHPPSGDKALWGKILVKKGAIIGMRATILPGAIVGEGAMVGAGSVVTKDIPAGEKWYGNPAMPHGKYEKPGGQA